MRTESCRTMATASPALRTTARRAGFALVAVVGILFAGVPAQAAPGDPSTSAEAAELVAARGHELEVITEQFNEARDALIAQHAAAEAAIAQAEQAQAALLAAQEGIVGIARTAYTGESMSSFRALMTSESADEFVGLMSTLQLVADHQNELLDAAATASVAAAQARATAQEAAAQAQAQYDAVAAQQADLEAQIAEYQAMYDRLTLAEQQAALATAQQQVRGIARAAYTGESMGSFRALMTSESADEFVGLVSTLQLVADHQNELLDAAATASVAAAQAAATAQDAAAQAQATYDAVVAQQKDLEAQIAEYQALYDRLTVEELVLVVGDHLQRAHEADELVGGLAGHQRPEGAHGLAGIGGTCDPDDALLGQGRVDRDLRGGAVGDDRTR